MLQYVYHAVNQVIGEPGDHGNPCGNIEGVGVNSEVNTEGGTEHLVSGIDLERNDDSTAMSDIIAEEDTNPSHGSVTHNKRTDHPIQGVNTK